MKSHRKSKTPLLRHLIGIEALNAEAIYTILNEAKYYLTLQKKARKVDPVLEGKIVANLFFEPSTRTRLSFEIAAYRLGAIVLSPEMESSATSKGESLVDTVRTIEHMGADIIVVRHAHNNTAQFIASELLTPVSVINAGDGTNQHPTQALLDLLTISQHKPNFSTVNVAFIGDVAHSRVARSLICGLKILGTQNIRIIAPDVFVPDDADKLKVGVYHSMKSGLNNVDVIVALRIQSERLQEAEIPDTNKFFNEFGLTAKQLEYANPNAIVMHPGPINRGIEIDSFVADGPQSVILQQVSNGVAIRMAVMAALTGQLHV